MPFKPRGPVAVLVAACALAAPATASADARDIARDYLNAHPDKFGVTSADVADVFVMSSYTTSGTGVTHVNVNQRHQGLEVFGGHATINVGPDGQRDLHRRPAGADRRRRVRGAAGSRPGKPWSRRHARSSSATRRSCACCAATRPGRARRCCPAARISDAPIGAQLGWWPQNGGVRLAWHSVIDDTDGEDAHLWSTTVDANTGAVLNTDDWTSHDNAKELGQRLSTPGRRGAADARVPAAVRGHQPAQPGAGRVRLPGVRVAERKPERRRAHAGREPRRLGRFAARLARHRQLGRRGLHHHAGQQRQRLHGPGLQQRAGLPVGAVWRLIAAVRLPARPDAARAGQP